LPLSSSLSSSSLLLVDAAVATTVYEELQQEGKLPFRVYLTVYHHELDRPDIPKPLSQTGTTLIIHFIIICILYIIINYFIFNSRNTISICLNQYFVIS
jgi:hypothetical protein